MSTALSTLDWTRELVSFDTTSRGSNLALIETVRDYLRGVGLESHLSHNDEGNKANLFASIPAADGSVQGGIVLSGIPMWCRSTARNGTAIRSTRKCARASCTGVARAT